MHQDEVKQIAANHHQNINYWLSTWSVYQHLARGELIQVLSDYPLATDTAIWAVYPSSRLLAPKVRVFIDYFADYYGSPPYWDKSTLS